MKSYKKPEVEYISLVTEEITSNFEISQSPFEYEEGAEIE